MVYRKTAAQPRGLRKRLILLRGVARRFFLNLLHKKYIAHSIARRQGACKRCGVCCHLVGTKCPALRLDKTRGNSGCRIYHICRPPNCSTFPIDPRDLADRDLVAPDSPCGYYWERHK